MNAPADFADRIAESRAKHLSPGIGAVWIGPRGAIRTAAHGVLVQGRQAPVNAANLWHIGSCTKAMTATLFARLVEHKRVRFDTALAEALPDLAPMMNPAFRGTPLSALLTHSAGIERDPADSTFNALRRSGAPVAAQRKFLAGEALKGTLKERAGYSNLGYIVLGAAIETLTARSWEVALARDVMIPLGIGRFGFGPVGEGQPTGHQRKLGKWQAQRGDNPAAYGPAGRVHLALDEWGRFLRVHLGAGPTGFLRADTLRTLHAADENGFAMGWAATRRHGTDRLHHTGSNTAWFAQATLLPERGIGIGIVCNSYSKAVAGAVSDLSDDLMREAVAGSR